MKTCPFCSQKKGAAVEVPTFNNPQEHLIIAIKDNHTHVHGPFGNEFVIREMIKSLLAEAEKHGIVWTPATDHRIGS